MPALLFLCTGNSARSPLAEAIAQHLSRDLDVWSAGARPTHVRPEVRAVLDEVGIAASGLRAKGMAEVPMDEVDVVVSLCLEDICPVLPAGVQKLTWPLPDPASAPSDERLEAFRATRDELLRRLPPLLKRLRGAA